MTNAELIKILQALPPDQEALVFLPSTGSMTINAVEERGIGPVYTVIYPEESFLVKA